MSKLTLFELTEKVAVRIAQRKNLARLMTGLSAEPENPDVSVPFAAEKDEVSLCLADTSQAGNVNVFVCNSAFCIHSMKPNFVCAPNPTATYACNSDRREYKNCDGDSFQCSDQSGSPTFSCKKDGSAADYFDCQVFDCGINGNGPTDETFDCNSNVDFLCGGEDYDCVDTFDCTAGHGFLCANHHDCEERFTCSGGQTKGCTENGQVVAVSCTPGPNVDSYAMPGANNNSDPGDFICADPGIFLDTFDCARNFQCEAASDFSCVDKLNPFPLPTT